MPFEKGKIPEGAKPWQPGQSGNPKGKVAIPDLKELIQENVSPEDFAEVLSKLKRMAKNGNIKAIQELLDRSFGKVTQVIKNDNRNVNYDSEKLTADQIKAFDRALENDF